MSVNPNLLSTSTVYANLRVLSDLKKDQKVTIEHDTGLMTVDPPYYGQTIQRWWWSAFNVGMVKQTFTQAFEVMNLEQEPDNLVKTYGHIVDLIPTAYDGIGVLSNTYQAENKLSVVKDLEGISTLFKERVGQLQAPGKPVPISIKAAQPLKSSSETESVHNSDEADVEASFVSFTSFPDPNVGDIEDPKYSPERNSEDHQVEQRASIDDQPQKKTAKKTSSTWKRVLCCCVKTTD